MKKQRMPGFEKIPGHGPAHDAKSDETDICHDDDCAPDARFTNNKS
jgi:hypothetical protein